jgi:hypothetical protein
MFCAGEFFGRVAGKDAASGAKVAASQSVVSSAMKD